MSNVRISPLVSLAVAAVLLSGCGGKVSSEFVAGCKSGGASEEVCECMYEKLEGHYGFEAMEAMQARNVTPPDFMEKGAVIAAECRGIEVPKDAAILGEPFVPPSTAAESEATVVTESADESAVDQAIQIAASAVSGEEYRDARHSASGDIDGDGRSDLAVVFTVEVASANTAMQNLAAFVRQQDGGLRFAGSTVVGAQGGASVGRVAIDQGSVVLTTLTLGPNDPDCCPSIETSTRFTLAEGSLKQMQ